MLIPYSSFSSSPHPSKSGDTAELPPVPGSLVLLGEVEDALTILVVILAVSGVEVINELRAKRAVAALS